MWTVTLITKYFLVQQWVCQTSQLISKLIFTLTTNCHTSYSIALKVLTFVLAICFANTIACSKPLLFVCWIETCHLETKIKKLFTTHTLFGLYCVTFNIRWGSQMTSLMLCRNHTIWFNNICNGFVYNKQKQT